NVLTGGAGADKLYGGGGSDTASYADATAGVVANFSNVALNTGYAKGDTYSSIENLTGSAFNDTLTGNGAANILKGGAGDDRLEGGGGNDTLFGGSGKDTFVFGTSAGAATIGDFEIGIDKILFDNGGPGTYQADSFTFTTTDAGTLITLVDTHVTVLVAGKILDAAHMSDYFLLV
ncbi:calcium-binding protein, partial [Rhizobium sp. Leaf341]|uniref:calcium-binding protein n=1 Tax=Rhizobium sp. Leaf341 TaxID=1736344 RepID=UPI003FD477F8